MKKNFLFLAALAVASCTTPEINPNPDPQPTPDPNKVEMTFNAGSEGTKTTILSNMDVAWLDTDQIAVFDGTAKNVFSITTNNSTSATFSGEVTKGSTDFYAAYPAALATGLSEGVISTSIPAEQIVPEGKNIGDGALVAVAHIEEDSFAFKNVPGVFKFTIDQDNITSVTIATMGGEALAGTINVTVGAAPAATVVEGVSSVTVKPASGSFAQGDYYAAVIPGTYASGISTVMTRSTDALGGVNQSKTPATIARNGGLGIGAVKAIEWGTYIKTAAELKSWSKNGDFTKAAILGADIEVGDWSGSFREAAFSGKFYGLGHKLYNFTYAPSSAACSFLYQPKSEVSNLYVGTKDGATYDGVSKFTLGNNTNVYCGLFTYTAAATVLKNVVNYATFEASTAKGSTGFVRIGSLVCAPNGGQAIGCKNYGKVICNASATGETNVGGLFGFFDSGNTFTITNCENHGEIVNNSSAAYYVGGLSGRNSGSSPVVAEGCKNYGKITVNASAATVYVAGLFPNIYKSANLKGCENHGTIEVNNAPSGALYIAGIVGNLVTSAVVDSCYNKAAISYSKNAANVWITGIVGNTAGAAADNIQLKKSKNEAALSATGTGNIFIGGICGYAKNIIITECVNNAKLSIDNASTVSSKCDVIGGVIAYSNDVVKFNNNENRGEISINTNTSSARVTAGGILGDCYWIKQANYNYNYASVNAKNVNTTATSTAAAGGFIGGDCSTPSNVGNWLERNYNYGDITAEATSNLGYAGGIAGCAKHLRFYRVWNYGAIKGSDATITGAAFGLSSYGANGYAYASVGGSVNGTALTSENWESYIMGTSSTSTYQDGKGAFLTK